MFVGVAEGAGVTGYTAGVECSLVGYRPILPLSPGGDTSVAGAVLSSLSAIRCHAIILPFAKQHRSDYLEGLMLLLTRKKLAGSYFVLISTSRS